MLSRDVQYTWTLGVWGDVGKMATKEAPMEERTGDNYHWTESDISGWASDRISGELERRGYVVKGSEIMVKVCQRMNTLGLVYTISFDAEKEGKLYGLKDFYSSSEGADGMEHFSWFLDFFKEMEAEAVLKFGNRVLDVDREVERKSCNVKSISAREVRNTDLCYKVCINCSTEEIKEFVSREEFISMWSGGRAVFSGKDIVLENVTMSNVERNNEVRMRWKFKEWDDFSEARISFEALGSSVRVTVNHRDVPIKEVESIRMWWHERMFVPISSCFGFVLRDRE